MTLTFSDILQKSYAHPMVLLPWPWIQLCALEAVYRVMEAVIHQRQSSLLSKAKLKCCVLPAQSPFFTAFLYSLQVRSKPAGVSSAGPNCDINLWTAGSCFSCNSTEDFKATVKLFEKWSIKWAANHKGGQSLGSLPVPCSWLCLESLSCQLFWRAQYVIIAACPRQHRI